MLVDAVVAVEPRLEFDHGIQSHALRPVDLQELLGIKASLDVGETAALEELSAPVIRPSVAAAFP